MRYYMKQSLKFLTAVNIAWIAAIFVLNFIYQKNGFDFTLKCICSGAFAALGLLNFLCTVRIRPHSTGFLSGMLAGLIFAFLGDVLIGYDFIIGASVFALGHVCFVIAYCFLRKMSPSDFIISGILFAGAAAFLLFSPLLTFDVPVFRVVCLVYALIISLMLGKAVGNCIRMKTAAAGLLAFASALFFFSDLMLVFDWFIGRWSWTDHACMGTYYPALCFMALAMVIHTGFLSKAKTV